MQWHGRKQWKLCCEKTCKALWKGFLTSSGIWRHDSLISKMVLRGMWAKRQIRGSWFTPMTLWYCIQVWYQEVISSYNFTWLKYFLFHQENSMVTLLSGPQENFCSFRFSLCTVNDFKKKFSFGWSKIFFFS